MPKSKPQIFYIHGGMTFRKRSVYLRWLKSREVPLIRKKGWADDYMEKHLGKKCQIINKKRS